MTHEGQWKSTTEPSENAVMPLPFPTFVNDSLPASERRFRALVENSSDGISLLTATGEILFSTPAGATMTGFPVGENYGKLFTEFVHPDDLSAVQDRFISVVLGDNKHEAIAFRYRHKNGTWRWLEATATNRLADPAVQAIVVNYRDITERKRAEEVLQASESRFRALIENSSDGITLLAADGTILFGGVSGVRMTGYAVGELYGDRFGQFIHPDDVETVQTYFKDVLGCQETVGPVAFRFRHKDGSWRWLEAVGINLLAEPAVQAVVVNYRDITERRKTDETAALYRALVERVNDAIEVIDPFTGRFLHMNEKGCSDLGYTQAEILSLTVSDIDPDVDPAIFAQNITTLRQSGSFTLTSIHRRKDGTTFPVEITVRLVVLDREYVVAVARDITERQQAEDNLRQSEQRLRLALEAASMGSWVWDVQTNHSIWNAQEYRLLGLEPAEGAVDANTFWRLVHSDDLPEMNRVIGEAVQHGTEYRHDFRIVRADGETRWLASRGQAFRDERTGEVRQMFGVNFDITESKLSEESLRRTGSLLRLVLNTTPNIIHVKDRDSRFLIANQALADFTNVPLAEIIGQRQTDIQHRLGLKAEQLQTWLALDRQVIDTGLPLTTIVEATDHKGVVHRHQAKKLPIELDGGNRGVLTIAVDITELHELMESLRSRLRQQQAVAELGLFAFKTDDLDAVLYRCVETVGAVLDNECCKVLELQPDGESLLLRAGVGWHEGLVGQGSNESCFGVAVPQPGLAGWRVLAGGQG